MSWSKKGKWILIIFILLGGLGAFVGYKIVYKPHETIEEQQAAFNGSAEDFIQKVAVESEKWQNSIVVLEGMVTFKDENGFTMNESIYCQVKNIKSLEQIKNNATLKVKGRFIGYDDLLEEIKLDKCILN